MIAAFAHLVRLGKAGFVFAREGVFGLVDPEQLPAPLPGPARLGIKMARLIERRDKGSEAARLSAALTALGPSYVKLGQFLATRPDVVGPALARDLESLQDKMAPFPQAVAEATICAAFDRKLSDLFVTFGAAGRRRLDRAGPPRRGRDGRGAPRRRRQGAAARASTGASPPISRRSVSSRATPRRCRRRRVGCG